MEYLIADCAGFSSENGEDFDNACNYNGAAHFTVDDLLDFSQEDETITDAFFDSFAGNSGGSSTVTAVESSNCSVSGGGNGHLVGSGSCRSFNESQLSGNELCVPYDDLPELEWLSNFVEESFSTDDLRFIPTTNASVAKPSTGDASSSASATVTANSPPTFPTDVSVPGKARSKRSRTAPYDWSSRLLHLSPSKPAPPRRREPADATGRKCLHCGSEKTPQWRTGPMGPKTLCNACGVRYKSGRLVPEYRPAASPTFVSANHSNSHRKVLELRRQKDLQQQLMNQASIFNGYVHHHTNIINGPDLRHMI